MSRRLIEHGSRLLYCKFPNPSRKSKIKVVKKILPWLIFIIFAALVEAALLIQIEGFPKSIPGYSSPVITQRSTSKSPEQKTISVFLVGDIMLNRGVEYMIETQGAGDFKFPFLEIADELKGAKLLFGNLEGPISDKGSKVGSIYSFRAMPQTIEGLNFAGFDVLSLANNHAFDYGRAALEDTFLRLKNADINYVGGGFNESEAFSPIIKEINGMKIAFLAYTNLGPETWKAGENNSGIAWTNEDNFEKIKKDIKSAKEKADILIVSLHSGEEYLKTPTQFQIDFSKMTIDAGADLVVGHHPHVVQKNEKYPSTSSGQAGWIFYSLGNFVFDQGFSEETMEGEILEVVIENKEIKEIIPKEIKINNYFQPEIIL